jgi:Major capsid protein N-terminus
MGGSSLLKVLTTGIQDERLYTKKTLYPFIKVWYKVTNFTTQWVRLDFENEPQFGRTAFCKLQRKGHLISRLFLVANMPDIISIRDAAAVKAKEQYPLLSPDPAPINGNIYPKVGWTNSLGHALCDRITLDIGGTRIEQLDSRLLEMLDEYNTPLEKVTVVNRLLPRDDSQFGSRMLGGNSTLNSKNTRCVVPIPFWFTRGDPACALPIDAIIADEVRVGFTFRNLNELIYTKSLATGNTSFDPGTALFPFFGQNLYIQDSTPLYPATVLDIPQLQPNNKPPTSFNQYQKIDIQVPLTYNLGETYLLAEYIYVDKPEANRLRVSDLQVPIVQHYALKPLDTNGLPRAILPLDVPNPARDIFWMFQRIEAPSYNNYFLSSRDLRNPGPLYDIGGNYSYLWWPNAMGLSPTQPGSLLPGFSARNSEPISALAIMYEGTLVRAQTNNPPLFRGILPSYQQKKTPWLNGYYYNFSFGVQNGKSPISKPRGHANLDKIRKREIYFELNPNAGCASNPNNVPRFVIYCWAETYNIFRVYGGRAGCLFAY